MVIGIRLRVTPVGGHVRSRYIGSRSGYGKYCRLLWRIRSRCCYFNGATPVTCCGIKYIDVSVGGTLSVVIIAEPVTVGKGSSSLTGYVINRVPKPLEVLKR